MKKDFFREIVLLLLIGLAYFFAGKLGLQLAFVNASATAVWPPTGIALAALLLFGNRVWPAIFLGAFLTNVTTAGTIATSLGIATGNTLEAVVGAYLVMKYAGGKHAFDRTWHIFLFTLLAAFLSTMVSATIGVTSLTLGGFSGWNSFLSVWTTWWLGDAGGALIVGPLLILWMSNPFGGWLKKEDILQALLAFLSATLVSMVVFGGILPYPYLCIPVLMWVAFRFGRRAGATMIFVLATIAVWYTLHGIGPYAREASINQSLLLVQLFLGTTAVTTLTLGALLFERRVIEEKVAREKVEDEALLASIGDGIIATDREGRVILINKAFEELMGWEEKEIVGRPTTERLIVQEENGDVIPGKERLLAKAFATGEKVTAVHYLVRKNETRFPARITATPVLLRNNIVGAVEVFHDITQERAVDRMKTEFVSIVSHELRTPLTAVKGLISMVFNGDYGPVNDGLKRPFSLIASSAERLIHLVNDMLDVSRLEAGKIKIDLEEYVAQDLITEAVSALKPLLEEKKIACIVEKSKNVPVQADKERVIEILNNLIGNALKFTEKGSIGIAIKEEGDFAIIYITDTGRGISKEDQQRLFGKFDQIDYKETGRPLGTGLGLYISREFAKKMGGGLWIEKSEPGKGSTFAFSLPLSNSKQAQKFKEALVKYSKGEF